MGGPALRSWLVGSHAHIVIVSTIRGATVGGFSLCPFARGTGKERWPSALSVVQACPGTRVALLVWCGSLPALARKTGAIACQVCPKGSQGKRGRRKGAGGNTLPPMRARIGRSRLCSRVFMSLQKSAVGILAQRSERFHFNRFGVARGRASSFWPARESVTDRGRRDAVPDRCGSRHVTALEIGPCRGNAGTLSMEGTSGHSRGLLFTEHLPMWSRHRRGFRAGESERGLSAKRQGCQRLGAFGGA